MNRIFLVGRLTKDPEKKVFEENDKVMARFIMAVDKEYKNSNGEKQTDFIPVVLWGKRAEVALEYLKKGDMISLCGKLNCRSYDDDQGVRRYISEVIAESFQFIESKNKENQVG
ncbi:single-stranded DNA-binding protein [Clostridium sp. 19966]|uniref:single-stranded DNA-binding protein n=1 Tax=Clostridium sp. 19966 TaxID=2768166 RepID=UPI0028DFC244|nr:single-stranded DNA-binding protein [Clostridium sp. 19966]MDT8716116.1 single-stranded DNA-binding protein [Clostridium sp. 19966]